MDDIQHRASLQHAREKQASRDKDQRRLAAGEVTREELCRENNHFAFMADARMRLDLCERLS
jgi:hypothetical protein